MTARRLRRQAIEGRIFVNTQNTRPRDSFARVIPRTQQPKINYAQIPRKKFTRTVNSITPKLEVIQTDQTETQKFQASRSTTLVTSILLVSAAVALAGCISVPEGLGPAKKPVTDAGDVDSGTVDAGPSCLAAMCSEEAIQRKDIFAGQQTVTATNTDGTTERYLVTGGLTETEERLIYKYTIEREDGTRGLRAENAIDLKIPFIDGELKTVFSRDQIGNPVLTLFKVLGEDNLVFNMETSKGTELEHPLGYKVRFDGFTMDALGHPLIKFSLIGKDGQAILQLTTQLHTTIVLQTPCGETLRLRVGKGGPTYTFDNWANFAWITEETILIPGTPPTTNGQAWKGFLHPVLGVSPNGDLKGFTLETYTKEIAKPFCPPGA